MPKEKLLKVGFYNNKFVKASQIKISPNNLAMTRGCAAFDFFRVINGRGFYTERHIDRFFNTLKLLRLSINYSEIELAQIVAELLLQIQEQNYFIKIYAIPGDLIKVKNKAKLLVLAVEMESPPIEDYGTGISLILKEYQRFLARSKINQLFANCFLAKRTNRIRSFRCFVLL
jgi:branched-chain amino acid aminotransferase